MNKLEELKSNLEKIEEKLKISFKDKNLLLLAFIHRSFVNENKKEINEHNERLEFLGDTALNLIVSEYLYTHLPSSSEGILSHIRSRLVNAPSCTKYYKLLSLNDCVLLGKGEAQTEERGRDTIYSDAFEALIGAIYLDQGFLIAQEFILKNFESIFVEMSEHPEIDYKGRVQEFSQKKYKIPPTYKIVKEEGPEHLKTFHVVLLINNEEIAIAIGPSKKEAEQLAAEKAFNKLDLKG